MFYFLRSFGSSFNSILEVLLCINDLFCLRRCESAQAILDATVSLLRLCPAIGARLVEQFLQKPTMSCVNHAKKRSVAIQGPKVGFHLRTGSLLASALLAVS